MNSKTSSKCNTFLSIPQGKIFSSEEHFVNFKLFEQKRKIKFLFILPKRLNSQKFPLLNLSKLGSRK